MLGMIIKGGTGLPEIMVNTDMIINSEINNKITIKKNIDGSGIINDIINNKAIKKTFIPNKRKK
jgi:hypothetical protein